MNETIVSVRFHPRNQRRFQHGDIFNRGGLENGHDVRRRGKRAANLVAAIDCFRSSRNHRKFLVADPISKSFQQRAGAFPLFTIRVSPLNKRVSLASNSIQFDVNAAGIVSGFVNHALRRSTC